MRRLRPLLAALAAALVLSPAAAADTSSTLTVVGTSDVQDSGLIPNLVTPMFERAYPQFTLKYVSLGTGAAIAYAEAGTASALVVHAASLENQFVAQGYSAEPFGRAIFWGDYVLLGPKSDPAHVLSAAPHDIAGAFEAIAAAGAAGKADFVSRANTSGTAVQEHLIWALTHPSATLKLCPVASGSGGGAAPSASASCGSTPSYPSWYHATGLTQGPNIENANTCNYANAGGGSSPDCYVFTDRGTFDCLISAACAGGSAAPTNLQVVTRDNDESARGGSTELVNSFHAYAINPAKFAGNSGVQINSTAAEDFLNFITSPSFQSQLSSYLGGTDGAPFIADASPLLTLTAPLPAVVPAGRPVTVLGSLANVVPGTPALAGVTVTLNELGGGLPAGVPIATAQTNPLGAFQLRFVPPSSGSYQFSTGQILKIENPSLNPPFGDILEPAATTPAAIAVQGVLSDVKITPAPGSVLATGALAPGSGHAAATVTLLARRSSQAAFRPVAVEQLGRGDGSFAVAAQLGRGRWQLQLALADTSLIAPVSTGPISTTVPAPARSALGFRRLRISGGRVSVRASISHAGPGRVLLLGLEAGLSSGAPGPAASELHQIAEGRARQGAAVLAGRLRRGEHYLLVLEYLPASGGQRIVSGLRSVDVS